MSIEQQTVEYLNNDRRKRLAGNAGSHPLQQAALRLGEVRDGRSKMKAKDLVGLLLCHGARAWRSSQPVAHSRVLARGPSGHPAIKLRFR